MEHTKFCCDGLNAVLIEPLFPVYRDVKDQKKVKFYTAIYQCRKCKELTVRGETNQLRYWTTFIEYITAEQVAALKKEKEQYDLAKTADGQMCPSENRDHQDSCH
jgi:hypothetical protein